MQGWGGGIAGIADDASGADDATGAGECETTRADRAAHPASIATDSRANARTGQV